MDSKEIPYVSMESKEIPYFIIDRKEIPYVRYGISLLSMLTYGIPTTLGRFDTNFTHYLSYLIPPQVTIFLFSLVKGGEGDTSNITGNL
jgi:hypothetical protein